MAMSRSMISWLFACTCCFVFGALVARMSLWSSSFFSYSTVSWGKSTLSRSERWGELHDAVVSDETLAQGSHGDRGIVICANDQELPLVVSLISEMRCIGNTEPIEVYHCFDELSNSSRNVLHEVDDTLVVVDLCRIILQDTTRDWFKGSRDLAYTFQSYWLKPLALVYTELTEVIILDADTLLLDNPTQLRQLEDYKETGTLFFRDRVAYVSNFLTKPTKVYEQTVLQQLVRNFPYAKFGVKGGKPSKQLRESFAYQGLSAHEMDSSLVLVDKSKASIPMSILLYLVTTVRFDMDFSWGDKEAFWLSYELAQQPYYFSPWGPAQVDSVPNQDLIVHPKTLCGSMAQYHPVDTDQVDLLYVNAKALLEPYPIGVNKTLAGQRHKMFNPFPTVLTPLYRRSELSLDQEISLECMQDLGAVELPPTFRQKLLRRQLHYMAVMANTTSALSVCHFP